MRVVFLLFDSLNRHALSPYGGVIPTRNFQRLAERSITFDRHFVGSLPCMPARRDMQTGRLNFLHRSWGPMEPFDDSFPQRLKEAGVYAHLVSDHYHYWEDGGATYHTRYNSWDFIRGQESDPWIAMVKPPLERFREQYHANQYEETRDGHRLQGMINRTRIVEEQDFPSVKCFDAGLHYLQSNGGDDNWLLQLETFDPHEPFAAPARFREAFGSGYDGPILDWPRYRKIEENDEEIEELKTNYAALVGLCDSQLGRLLYNFDANDRWRDTALILTTDHGFMLGEHDWWAKNRMPCYNEIAHIPLFVYHPEMSSRAGTRVGALTQSTDLMATMLDLFDVEVGAHVLGKSMLPLAAGQTAKIRDIALYGLFAGAINATDGRYTYFRYPQNMETQDLFEYTLMPMHNRSLFEPRELESAELHPGFDFTQGSPVLKIPALADAKRSPRQGGFADTDTVLFDMETDPHQMNPLQDRVIEDRLCAAIIEEMQLHDAPSELFQRLDLPAN